MQRAACAMGSLPLIVQMLNAPKDCAASTTLGAAREPAAIPAGRRHAFTAPRPPTLNSRTEAVKMTMMSWQPTTLCATSGQNCGEEVRMPRQGIQGLLQCALGGWDGQVLIATSSSSSSGVQAPKRTAHLTAALVLPLVHIQGLVPVHTDGSRNTCSLRQHAAWPSPSNPPTPCLLPCLLLPRRTDRPPLPLAPCARTSTPPRGPQSRAGRRAG